MTSQSDEVRSGGRIPHPGCTVQAGRVGEAGVGAERDVGDARIVPGELTDHFAGGRIHQLHGSPSRVATRERHGRTIATHEAVFTWQLPEQVGAEVDHSCGTGHQSFRSRSVRDHEPTIAGQTGKEEEYVAFLLRERHRDAARDAQ